MPLAKHHEAAIRGLDAKQFKTLMSSIAAHGIVIRPPPRKPEQLVHYCRQPGDPALHPRDLAMPLVRATDKLQVAILEQLMGHPITRAPTKEEREAMSRKARSSRAASRGTHTPYHGETPRRELVVRVLAKTNPHPPSAGVHHRFSCYRDGQTVEECVARGVRMCDVKFHERRGDVKLMTREAYDHETR